MKFRKSEKKDINIIMEIINEAKDYFKNNRIDQWQNDYPNEKIILNDINNSESYVLCDENEKIIASCVISFREEKSYNIIEKGKWKSSLPYAVIHRIAIKSNLKGMGISNNLIKETEKMCLKRNIRSIRIDTQKDNKSMQKFIIKNNFEYCGIIYISDGSERLAYEKLL